MSARQRILERVRGALAARAPEPHPGDFGAWRGGEAKTPVDEFALTFGAAGGELVHVGGEARAAAWLADFSKSYETAVVGATVPAALRPPLEGRPAHAADLGVSMAKCAIGETGSLVLAAGDGRRAQLLPPTHVVFVKDTDVVATLRDALLASRETLPSALGLHSGPSKSADIGQILVKGVHGPGRVIAVLIGESP